MESVSKEPEQQGAGRLPRCSLPAHADVFRVPWEDLIHPQVISLACTPEDRKDSPGEDADVPFRGSDSSPLDVKPLPFSEKGDQSPRSSEEDDSEGEYVELSQLALPSFSPQKGSLTQSISLQAKVRSSTRAPQKSPARKPTPKPTDLHSSGARPAPQASSQLSASPPAPSEDQGTRSSGGETWMVVRETAGEDSAWKEELKEQVIEEPVGAWKESDGEEMDEEQLAEVVEVEEEVRIIIQQNQDRMQEGEKKADVQTEAASQDVDSPSSSRSFCEKNPEQRQGRDSSPPAGSGGRSKEKEEGADEKGAPAFTSQGTFFSFTPSFTSCVWRKPPPCHSLTPSSTTAPSVPTHPSPAEAEAAQSGQSQQTSFSSVLLRSGAVCLPGEVPAFCCLLSAPPVWAWLMFGGSSSGSRDRGGRALLTISARSSVWSHPDRHAAELFGLLLYYRSMLR